MYYSYSTSIVAVNVLWQDLAFYYFYFYFILTKKSDFFLRIFLDSWLDSDFFLWNHILIILLAFGLSIQIYSLAIYH